MFTSFSKGIYFVCNVNSYVSRSMFMVKGHRGDSFAEFHVVTAVHNVT